jgi:hypothetical protein
MNFLRSKCRILVGEINKCGREWLCSKICAEDRSRIWLVGKMNTDFFHQKPLFLTNQFISMQTIEIQKGVKVGFEDLLKGAAQMGTEDLEKFMDRLGSMLARRKAPKPSERELELLKMIYEPLKAKTQRRYDLLNAKLREEGISTKEHKELLTLVEAAEEHNVDWLKALIELAQLRGISVEDLMVQLGLGNPKLLEHVYRRP